jgi:signal transduction histidine kinase
LHLLSLINDILDECCLDAGRMELREEDISLSRKIAATIQMLSSQAAEAQVRLVAQTEGHLPLVRADKRRLFQVLTNVMSNAIKFTPAGGTVVVRAFREGGEVIVSVADDGIGMAASDIPKAFEEFVQIDSGMSRRYEGTGLGLPLARRIMELHKGRLVLESDLHKGTTVKIIMPAERVVPASLPAAFVA